MLSFIRVALVMVSVHSSKTLHTFFSFFSFSFIGYFLYLHFKYYPLSWFPHWKNPQSHPTHHLPSWGRSPIHGPTPSYLPALAFPHTGASSLPRTKGLSSHWCSTRPIVCYICGWSHGSLHVYSLVDGLVPGSSEVSGWLLLLFFL